MSLLDNAKPHVNKKIILKLDIKNFFESIKKNKPIDIIKNIKHLRKIIMTHHIDIVHCHHRMAAFYMRLYNSFYHIPIVYTLHLADVPCNYIYRKMTFVGDKAMGVSSEVSIFLVDKFSIAVISIGVTDSCTCTRCCTLLYVTLEKVCTFLYVFPRICTHKVMPNERTP